MMKISAILLTLVFAGTLCAAQNTSAPDTMQGKKAAAAKESRWQGHIVRMDKAKSSLSVRGGMANMESTERQIFYDQATEWTKLGKPAKQSDFKDGAFVIVLGNVDHKGIFHATRIDLRTSR